MSAVTSDTIDCRLNPTAVLVLIQPSIIGLLGIGMPRILSYRLLILREAIIIPINRYKHECFSERLVLVIVLLNGT